MKTNGIQWNSNGIMLQKAYACKPSYNRCSLFWGCVIFQNPKKIVGIVDIVGGVTNPGLALRVSHTCVPMPPVPPLLVSCLLFLV